MHASCCGWTSAHIRCPSRVQARDSKVGVRHHPALWSSHSQSQCNSPSPGTHLGKLLALLGGHRPAVAQVGLQGDRAARVGHIPRPPQPGQKYAARSSSCHPHTTPHHMPPATAKLAALTLLPMSMMVMLGLACCRASSSQLARCSNVCGRGRPEWRHGLVGLQVGSRAAIGLERAAGSLSTLAPK